jgi:hypothetical protein
MLSEHLIGCVGMRIMRKDLSDAPWQEDTADRAKAARAIVINARVQAERLAEHLPDMARSLKAFAADLAVIETAYAADPALFRRNRALTAVHLPAIITSLETLAEMRAAGTDDDALKAVTGDITDCLKVTRQARKRLDDIQLDALAAETAVLRDGLEPPEVDLEEGTGWRVPRALTGLAARGGDALSTTASRGRTAFAAMGSSAIDRLGSGAGAVGTLFGGIVEDGVDMVTSPVARRMSALSHALASASSSALIGGVVTAIVFPPAIPVAIGLAVLDGSSGYADALEKGDKQADAAREARKQDRGNRLTAQLARFRGTSPTVRMETPHVHVTLNAETGAATGLLLTGQHAGEALERFNKAALEHLAQTAPDAETREILETWAKNRDTSTASKSETDATSKDQTSSAELFGVGFDLFAFAALP